MFTKEKLIVVVLLCALILTGCNDIKSVNENETDDPGQDETTAVIEIIKDSVLNYRITKPEHGTAGEIAAADEILRALQKKAGIAAEINNDHAEEGQKYQYDEFEILIGRTSHPASQSAYGELEYGSYIIKSTGKKIVIAALNDDLLLAATNEFITIINKSITKDEKGSQLMISKGLDITRVGNKFASCIPKYRGGGVFNNIYPCGHNNQMVIIEKTNAAEYSEYLGMLKDMGFSDYMTREIESNLFATYIKDNVVLHINYTSVYNTVRIVSAVDCNIPKTVISPYERIVDSSLTQIGQEYPISGSDKYLQNGMCYIIRLADGSFIIIDGGFSNKENLDRIYNTLYEQSPDKEKIIIAAWILTHAHNDHVCAFISFAQSEYSKKVKVESVIYNFPTEAELDRIETSTLANQSDSAVSMYYPEAKYYKPYTGALFNIRNCTIEILYTFADYYPQTFTSLNSSSLVFRVEIEGQKILILGDTNADEHRRIIQRMYDKYLKSDIVQLAHHGSSFGVKDTYTLVNPQVVLWPAGEHNSEILHALDDNLFWRNNLKVKEEIYAGSSIRTINLPYYP